MCNCFCRRNCDLVFASRGMLYIYSSSSSNNVRLLSYKKVGGDDLKVVVVKSPAVIGFVLRKIFKIKKVEQTEG